MLHVVDGELDGCTSRLQINDVLVVAIGKTTNISLENHGIYDAALASSTTSEKDGARHQTSGTLPSDNQPRHVGRDFRPGGPSLPEMARY